MFASCRKSIKRARRLASLALFTSSSGPAFSLPVVAPKSANSKTCARPKPNGCDPE